MNEEGGEEWPEADGRGGRTDAEDGRTRRMISFDGRGDSEPKRKICNGEKYPPESRRSGRARKGGGSV